MKPRYGLNEQNGVVLVAALIVIPILVLFIAAGVQILKARVVALETSYIAHQVLNAGNQNRGHPQDALSSASAALRLFDIQVPIPVYGGAVMSQRFDRDGDGVDEGAIELEYLGVTDRDDALRIRLLQTEYVFSGLFGILDPLFIDDNFVGTGFNSKSTVFFDNSMDMVIGKRLNKLYTAFGIGFDPATQEPLVMKDRLRLPFATTRLRFTPDPSNPGSFFMPGNCPAIGINSVGREVRDLGLVDAPAPPGEQNGWCLEPWDIEVGAPPCAAWEATVPNLGQDCPSQSEALLIGMGDYVRDYKEVTHYFLQWLNQVEISLRVGVLNSATYVGTVQQFDGAKILCDGNTGYYDPINSTTVAALLTEQGNSALAGCGGAYSLPSNVNIYPGVMRTAQMAGRISPLWPKPPGGWATMGSIQNWNGGGTGFERITSPLSYYEPGFPNMDNNPVGCDGALHPLFTSLFPVAPVAGCDRLYPLTGPIVNGADTRQFPQYYTVDPAGVRTPNAAILPPSPEAPNPVVSYYCPSLWDAAMPTNGGKDLAKAVERAKDYCLAQPRDIVCINYFVVTGLPHLDTPATPPACTTIKTVTFNQQLNRIRTALNLMTARGDVFNVMVYLRNPVLVPDGDADLIDFHEPWINSPTQPDRYLHIITGMKPGDPPGVNYKSRLQDGFEKVVLWARESTIFRAAR